MKFLMKLFGLDKAPSSTCKYSRDGRFRHDLVDIIDKKAEWRKDKHTVGGHWYIQMTCRCHRCGQTFVREGEISEPFVTYTRRPPYKVDENGWPLGWRGEKLESEELDRELY